MRAFLFAAAILFTAANASAQAPTSIEEYDLRRAQLKQALKDGSGDQRVIRDELANLKEWYKFNTHRQDSSAFVGGIILSGVGGATLIAGALVMLVGAMQSISTCIGFGCTSTARDPSTYYAVGGTMMIGGAIAGIAGIPLAIYGGKRVYGPPDMALLRF